MNDNLIDITNNDKKLPLLQIRIIGYLFLNQQNQKKKPGETLEEYGVDLTKMAKDGKLDPVIARHEEIRRTLQILGKQMRYEYGIDVNLHAQYYSV